MRQLSIVLILGILVGLVPRAAYPKARRIAFVIVPQEAIDAPIIAAVEEFFLAAIEFYPDFKILQGPSLPKKLKRGARRCDTDVLCVARIGRRMKVDEVVLGRVTNLPGGGAQFQFLAVDVVERAITRKLQLDFPNPAEVQPELARDYFEIMGITTPGYIELTGAPPTVRVDGVEMSTTEGPLTLAPGPRIVEHEGQEHKVMVLPGEIRKLELAPEIVPPIEVPETEVTETVDNTTAGEPEPDEIPLDVVLAEEPEVTEVIPPAETDSSMLPALEWTGIGLAGAGAVALGVGAVFGAQAKVDLSDDPDQVEVVRRNEDAEAAASRANIMIIAGAATVAVGAGLWAFAFFSADDESTTVAPVALEGGAGVIVRQPW